MIEHGNEYHDPDFSTVDALNDLSDVTISNPAEDDFLRYSSGSWVNEAYSPTVSLDYEYAEGSTDISLSSTSWTLMTGCSITLGAGTWLIQGSATMLIEFKATTSAYGYLKIRNTDDNTDHGGTFFGGYFADTKWYGSHLVCFDVVTIASEKDYELQWKGSHATNIELHNLASDNSAYHRSIYAFQLA